MTARWVKSWDDSASPVPISRLPEMYAAGYRVWMRYLALGSAGKHWTDAQIAAWFACGPDTGVVGLAEAFGTEPVTDPTIGASHAIAVRRAARALGWPDHVSMVPAMDENVSSADWVGPIVTYCKAWDNADAALPVMYVEADAGAYLHGRGLTAGTFTPAAWGWESPARTKPFTPADAPAHVVMTQEHNGRDLAGGNVDIGNTRTDAPCVWWNPEGVSPMAMNWSDQVVESGDPNNPEWSVSGTYKWMVSQLRTLVSRSGAAATQAGNLSLKLDQLAAKLDAVAGAQAPAVDVNELARAIVAEAIAKMGAAQ